MQKKSESCDVIKMDSAQSQTKNKLQNFLKNDRFRLLIPTTGAISYEIFSTKILLHQRFSALFGSKDAVAADILWMNSHIGIGLYLYQQKCLSQVPTPWRITYSVFGAAMFNFGSALFWGTARTLYPEASEWLRLAFGVSSGMLLMYIGWSFFQNMEELLHKKTSGMKQTDSSENRT